MRHASIPFLTIVAAVTTVLNTGPAYADFGDELFKLLPGDGAEGDIFGFTIAIDNGIVVVGARNNDDNGASSGSAYLFDAATGRQITKLLPSDGAELDVFGISIAIDNGVVAVGADHDDDNGENSGSAYLFDASTGIQIAKLLPSDGAELDFFGGSIAISDGIVAVGADHDDDNGNNAGAAYLFDASTGAEIAKLLPSDGGPRDWFGWPIAIDNGIVAVGAIQDDDKGSNAGAVYLFDASTGAQIAKLLANDGARDDHFGRSIAIDNGIVAVGASHDDDNGDESGSAYLFDASTGIQIAKLLPNDGAEQDLFGVSIAIGNGIVVVGVQNDDDNGRDSGSAYLFDASTGAQIAKLLPGDGSQNDNFGFSIAIDNGVVAIGAMLDDDNGDASGSAYLFDANPPESCLDLTVDNLIAGESAIFTINGGTPGAKSVTVYGTKVGQTIVNNIAGYCATFDIRGVNPTRVLGGLNQTFDGNGEITFELAIPGNLSGQRIFFQNAQRSTCPDECMSNLVVAVVQ